MVATAAGDIPIIVEDSPPSDKLPPGEWLKKNLFSTPGNSLLTIVLGAFFAFLFFLFARFVITSEWQIVRTNLANFMVGRFPRDELWRQWVSLYFVLLAVGTSSGALARSAHELALEQELPTEKETFQSLLRRFWPIVLAAVFFVSFARTLPPFIGLVIAFVVIVVAREVGWRLPAAVRNGVLFFGTLLILAAMFVLAGASNLMGFTVGAVIFAWVSTELSRRNFDAGLAGLAKRQGPALIAGVIAWIVIRLIPFEGFGWEDWGGLHVTFFVTVIGIGLGMPIGTMLAVARRSNLSVLQSAAVIFIEFVRGVPLISLLLFSQILLPFFLPQGFERPADLTLAIFVIMFFSAAYIAEIVRGGLQAVPKGQTEAGQAGGMSAWNIQRMIVLPQALRSSIPAMVGQFIALFKDTTLLVIIGIGPELLGVAQVANAQSEFVGRGLAPLTYIFVAVGYWAFAYTLSKESRRLEAKLGVGTR